MDPDRFDTLHEYLFEFLKPVKNTRPNDCISAREKLAFTLEYFASGDLLRHVASCYRISKQHAGDIIEDVCVAIFKALKPKCLPRYSKSTWIDSANLFNARWNMPNCIGSIDGKHCGIKCPENGGSSFYNYKGFHSIVLMAVASADYKFLYYDIGAYGSEGDSAVFRKSDFGEALMSNKLDLPAPQYVNGQLTSYYFVADDAFPLHRYIMKPYKPKSKTATLPDYERVFNYRLSRARRTVENAFGILCIRWMVLARTMLVGVDKAKNIIEACCLLHNFLMTVGRHDYAPSGFGDQLLEDGTIVEGFWRRNIPEDSLFNTAPDVSSGRPSEYAKNMRDNLMRFVNSESGSLNWQRRKALCERNN